MSSPDEPNGYAVACALARRAMVPARCGPLLFGTAGWTDRTLLGPGLFYPPSAGKPEARLRYYASQFPMVEVDATYYALLSAKTVGDWVARTPPGFVFDVKAHPALTGHPVDWARLPADLREACPPGTGGGFGVALPRELREELERRFFLSLQPLVDARRLGSVLLQFPPWFDATRGHARLLEGTARRVETSGMRFSVELRHRSWFMEDRPPRLLALLRSLGFGYVCVDEPDGQVGGVPPLVAATRADLAIVRLHGQNAVSWHRGSSVHERFRWLYSPRELMPWVQRLLQLADQVEEVHVVFNNCFRNYAVLGAKNLAALVAAGGQVPPTAGRDGGEGLPSGGCARGDVPPSGGCARGDVPPSAACVSGPERARASGEPGASPVDGDGREGDAAQGDCAATLEGTQGQ